MLPTPTNVLVSYTMLGTAGTVPERRWPRCVSGRGGSGDSRGWPGVARATPESSLATPVATPDVIGSW